MIFCGLQPSVLDGDVDHVTNLSGDMVSGSREPIILAGTANKIAAYSSEVYADMHSYFRQKLSETKNLVICGYGFGDKGINTEILRKAYGQRETKIIIIHPNISCLLQSARNAVKSSWNELFKLGRLIPIETTFKLATWDDIAKKLG